jgi:hypothetical protein
MYTLAIEKFPKDASNASWCLVAGAASRPALLVRGFSRIVKVFHQIGRGLNDPCSIRLEERGC